MAPSANRFQHHFKLRSICKHPCVFLRTWHSLKWMFITIGKMFFPKMHHLLENCVRFPQTLKQNSKFQDGFFFAYVMVLVSKEYGIPWKMCAKFFLSLKTMNSLRDTQYSPKTMELYSKMYIALLRSFWSNMHFPSCRRHYFGKHPLQKWWTRSIKKSAQLVHIE